MPPPAHWVSSQPRPTPRLQGLQPGVQGGKEGPCGRRAFSPRTQAQPDLPFPVPQFPIRLQGLRRRLFRLMEVPSRAGEKGEDAPAVFAATSLQG